ncbi:hypothetical protein JRO89_XS04G0183700 [Xanthoceras sorbifolium]|uniref:Major facilitator superfamily (MFS) profile domain-containing protein n=1 Tax=Xanthoceras sorbifolium TaxID=99658 RepID=A0ABQ8I5U2_9ROSI|nr:hypothetical protein JRO89_XS04G0183700 [Xanthoceras sorbifolium]
MAKNQDIERGNVNLAEPFIDRKRATGEQSSIDNGDLRMVFLSTVVAVCGSFEFGSCMGYSSPAQFGIMEDLNLSYSEYSVFGSIVTIGAMFGAISSGRIADFAGRKGNMRMSSIVCIAGWFAIYIASGDLLLDFGRFFTGFGIGNLSYVVPVYIAEITPKNLRGALATTNQLFITVGIAVAYIIGAFVSWRTLALTGIVPSLVMLIGLFFIPESPRWLAMVGRQKEFEVALRALRGVGANVSQEQTEIQDSIEMLRQIPEVGILDLFNSRNIRYVTLGVGLMVFQQFIGINGIIYYAGQIFVSAGVAPNVGSILYSSLQVVLTAVGATLMDKAGRRLLLLISVSGILIGNLLTGISFILKEHHLALDIAPILAITGVLVYIGSFSVGAGPVPWVIMSEIFPINVKGTAGSLVTLVNWFGSWVVSYSFFYLFTWSSWGVFFVYAAFCVMAIIFTMALVPETKGRTLEEIQASINN